AFPTKVTGNKLAVVTIAGLKLPSLGGKSAGRFRFVFEFDVIGSSITPAEWYAVGPMFGCVDTAVGANFYGLGWLADAGSGSSRGVHVQGGVVSLSGSIPAW